MKTGRQRGDRPKAAVINGLLLLNKPSGMSSNQALQRVKRLLKARKAGHTGSLDPAATGMLPLCFGEATKVSAYLLDADKTYRVTARLGVATNTGDAEGHVTETAGIPDWQADEWAATLESFRGESKQVPPMFSALKQDGKRLYELARKGATVAREPRRITIFDLGLLELAGDRLVFRVRCSKGTYVRTLVEDIASAAGTVAHTAHLHRESVAGFGPEQMLDLRGIKALVETGSGSLIDNLIAPDVALADWPRCTLDEKQGERFRSGQAVPGGIDGTGLVRVYDDADRFLGVGELTCDGLVAPRRVFRPADEVGD